MNARLFKWTEHTALGNVHFYASWTFQRPASLLLVKEKIRVDMSIRLSKSFK